MMTLSREAGQSSEPGMLLKETRSGCSLAMLAVPHACKMMRRVAAAPPREMEVCEAQQEALERMKHCSNSTDRQKWLASIRAMRILVHALHGYTYDV